MKKPIFVFAALAILIASSSCKKTDTASSGGTALPQSSWTFKGTTYKGDTCEFVNGDLVCYAMPYSGYNTPIVFASFKNNGVPTASGTYTVVRYGEASWGLTPLAIVISCQTADGNSYNCTGGNGTETVQVTVAASGKVSMSGTGIELINTLTGSTDSASISLNVVQTF